MIIVIAGVFLVLHGFVHLLYFGQSARLFELKPGMIWPDGSWAFSKLLGDNITRTLAIVFCIIAAAGLMIAGAGIFFSQSWWRTAAIASTIFSAILFILFWNGRMQNLDGQGVVGILIDMAILLTMLIFRWPAIG